MGSDECCSLDKFDFIRIFFGIATFLLLVPGVYLIIARNDYLYGYGSLIACVIVGVAFILLGIFGFCAAIFKHKGLVNWYIGVTILYEFFCYCSCCVTLSSYWI